MGIDRLASWTTLIVTVLSLPIYFAVLNDWGRKIIVNHMFIGYALLAAIFIVCLAGMATQLGWIDRWLGTSDFQRIVGRTFQNQTVEVDGKLFEDCTFNNVIFRYRGGRVGFVRAIITGTKSFETSDLGATGAVNILGMLQFLDPTFAASWRSKSPEDFQ
jgi:hypothetical protein